MEEESKTKFSMNVEFSFSFKLEETKVNFLLPNFKKIVIIFIACHSYIITCNGEEDGCR